MKVNYCDVCSDKIEGPVCDDPAYGELCKTCKEILNNMDTVAVVKAAVCKVKRKMEREESAPLPEFPTLLDDNL